MVRESTGKIIRSSRIFREDNKTLVVAMDHGLQVTVEGIEDIRHVINLVIEGGADAVMLNPGIAMAASDIIGGKIGLILSIPFDVRYVEFAVKIGADGIKTTYFGRVPLSETKQNQMAEIVYAAKEWEIPYMLEIVPADEQGKPIYDLSLIKIAARIGAELGADMIKTAYVGPVDEYKKVIEVCKTPVLIMGGPRMEKPTDILKIVHESVAAGAAGGAIGRNIWQYKDPKKMTMALSKIIHENIELEQAEKILM